MTITFVTSLATAASGRLRLHSRQCRRRCAVSSSRYVVATLEPEDIPGPRFARGSGLDPQKSFFKQPKKTQNATQRLRDDINSTLETMARPPKPSPKQELVDISRVSPANALGGGLIALTMFAGLWYLTSTAMEFYSAHPGNDGVYVVQRISAVVRTIIITALALSSGLSGITGCGLIALAARVTWGRINGEFKR